MILNSFLLFLSTFVGLTSCNPNKANYVVSLRSAENQHVCCGTLIDLQTVVTAAVCAQGTSITHVVVGSTSLDKGGIIHKIKRTILHPSYNHSNFYKNDIALLILDTNVIQKYKLPKIGSYKPSHPACEVIGWGTNESGKMINDIKVSKNQVVPDDKCRANLGKDFNACLMCATSQDSLCAGNSGAPLICDHQFVGIVSFGIGCGSKRHSTNYFQKTQCARDWINSIVKTV